MASRKKSDKRQPDGAKKPFKVPDQRRRAPFALTAICLAVVACAALVPYANSFNGELFFDNLHIIKENPVVTKEANLSKIFSSNYWAGKNTSNLYRPLTILSYHLQYVNFECGEDPQPYHIVNFLLHTANALLVFFVLLRLARTAGKFGDDSLNVLLAAFGGALFAAHPITTESVTNVVGRADLLVMFFLLCGFLLHMAGVRKPGKGAIAYCLGAAVCLGLGMLSKENAIAGIAVFAAYDVLFVFPRREGEASFGKWALQRIAHSYWFYALVIALWFLARYFVLKDEPVSRPGYVDNPLAYFPFLQREATAIVVLGLYLWRMVWPVTLSADYSPEQIAVVQSVFDWRLLASVAALAAIAVITIYFWRKSPLVSFLMLFFFLVLAPVSNILLIVGTIGAERLLYVPSLGWAGALAFAAAYLISRTARGWNARSLALPCAFVAVVLGLYCYRTHLRNIDWQTDLAFWRKTAETSPRSERALQGYAEVLLNSRLDLEKSRDLLEEALKLPHCGIGIYSTLGNVYLAMYERAGSAGNPAAAAQYLDSAYKILKKGMEKDRAGVQEYVNEKKSGAPGSNAAVLGNFDLNAAMAKACSFMAQDAAGSRASQNFLEEAEASARATVLMRFFDPQANIIYAEILMNQVRFHLDDPARVKRLCEDAFVSLCRALTMAQWAKGDIPGGVWDELNACYAKISGQSQPMYGRGMNHLLDMDKDRKYLTRAFRSMILIARANETNEKMEDFVTLAVMQYGVSRAELLPATTEPASLDDPRLLSGRGQGEE
jgi:tetratricopeptide (TPR) repeat protein